MDHDNPNDGFKIDTKMEQGPLLPLCNFYGIIEIQIIT
jgi:hypothetical protein